MHASLVDWFGLLLSGITVILVGLYLRETNRIRIATEAQLEAQIAPAIVVRVQPDGELQFVNLGSGPALHVRLSATERGSTGTPDLDRLRNDIDFIEKQGDARGTGIRTTPSVPELPAAMALNGRSLQCQYSSLSGRTYWTVVDFDRGNNNLLIATRFRSSLS
jgi:hypothetical protein